MATKKNKNEINELGRQAAISAEIASDNIKKYLEAQQDTLKKWNMRIADGMKTNTGKLIDESVKLAAKNLEIYLKNKGKG